MQKRNNQLKRPIIWAFLFFYSFLLFPNKLLIQKDYNKVAEYSFANMPEFKTHTHAIKIFDPLIEKKTSFSGIKLTELLNKHFGDEWKTSKNLILSATDGYRKIVSLKKIKKYLATAPIYISYQSDKNKLPIMEKRGRTIDFGPYYALWGGCNKENYKQQLRRYSWVYQLKSINLQTK